MTAWKLTIRTAPGALVAAEYLCPVHGRFALDVPRDELGDPPMWSHCNEVERGCFEACGYVISAPGTAKVRRVEAVRGSYAKPEFETWTNCENLGEGQDIDDWKADRAKVWEREREREAMELAREL